MKNNLIVREPEEMVLMRGEFSESALKLSAYLIANLKENQNIYEINVKEYLKKFDLKIGNYTYLKSVAEELSKKQFKMEDRFEGIFAIYNFISSIEYRNNILSVEFSSRLMKYLLRIKDKYLKYNIKNIISLHSKYSIRLYKILKDKFEQENRYNKKTELKIDLTKIKEILEIPKSYKFNDIKRFIIEKSKKELSEHTDIIFNYEEIKTGRKITHIKFFIYKNPKNYKKDEPEQKKEVSTTPQAPQIKNKTSNNWNDWRKELLNKGNLIINFNDKIFEVKNNYLFKDKKLLSSEKSFEIWQELYENRNNLKIMNEDEYIQEQIKRIEERENKYKKLDELKEKYNYLIVKINGEHKAVILSDIQLEDNIYKLYMSIFGESRTVYQNFESLEKLEEFLEVCYDAYLRNKGKI